MTRRTTGRLVPLPAGLCPSCGSPFDVGVGADGATWAPGDLSVCAYCATILEVEEGGGVHVLAEHDLMRLPALTFQRVRATVAAAKAGPLYGMRPRPAATA